MYCHDTDFAFGLLLASDSKCKANTHTTDKAQYELPADKEEEMGEIS